MPSDLTRISRNGDRSCAPLPPLIIHSGRIGTSTRSVEIASILGIGRFGLLLLCAPLLGLTVAAFDSLSKEVMSQSGGVAAALQIPSGKSFYSSIVNRHSSIPRILLRECDDSLQKKIRTPQPAERRAR